MAPSTANTYRAGIRQYLSFCQTHGHTPLPGSQHTVSLFATHLSRTLQANTIQVYVAAVSHLHLTQGLSSPTTNNPMLSLAIRGIQRSQDPAYLRPRRQPLTNAILVQMLDLLDSDHLQTHDRLMVKAALTLGFFGFLRVSEFTTPGRGKFNPRIHPTRQDITWSEDSLLFFIKKSKTDQAGRGTTISVGSTGGATCPVSAMEAYLNHCRESHQTALIHFQTGRPLSSRAMRSILRDLLHRLGHDSSQYNTHSLRIGAATAAARAGLPPSTIQRLGRWRSSAFTAYTRYALTRPTDCKSSPSPSTLIHSTHFSPPLYASCTYHLEPN